MLKCIDKTGKGRVGMVVVEAECAVQKIVLAGRVES